MQGAGAAGCPEERLAMAELKYTAFQNTIETPAKTRAWVDHPVFLVFGDELLVERVQEQLLERLLVGVSRAHGFEAIDGRNENVREALARLNTFSLLSQRKVVSLKDARVFYSRQQHTDYLQKARTAAGNNRMDQAARWLCDLLGVLEIELDDLADPASVERLLDGYDPVRDADWLGRTLVHAKEKGMVPGSPPDVQQDLEQAVAAGFPKGHHLLITTDVVDRRRRLYKMIVEKGMVVDCAVPGGGRSAGRDPADAVIRSIVADRLATSGKEMDREAVALLVEKTGTDLRMLTSNVDQLVDFVGDREAITVADVDHLLQRTRQDPLYAFTNAVTDRNLSQSLFYLESLLGGGEFDHPLPLLAAVLNQIRKLLLVKSFIESPIGRVWRPSLSYPLFQKQVVPIVQDFDRSLADRIAAWHEASEGAGEAGAGKRGSRKKTPVTDLFLARKIKSPYPLYKLFVKSERFTGEELVGALASLAEADARLKQSGTDGRLVLEQVLFRICSPDPPPAPG